MENLTSLTKRYGLPVHRCWNRQILLYIYELLCEFLCLPLKGDHSEFWGDQEVGMVLPEHAHNTQTQGGGVVPHQTGLLVQESLLHITQLFQ